MRCEIYEEIRQKKADYTKLFIKILKLTSNNAVIIVISQYYCKYRSHSLSQTTIITKSFRISLINRKQDSVMIFNVVTS